MSDSHKRTQSANSEQRAADRAAARDLFIRRFRAAEALLKAGLSGAQVRRLARTAVIDRLLKYSPDQPRVPAGSGRTSGQWTAGSTSQSAGPAPARRRPDLKRPATPGPRPGATPRAKPVQTHTVAPLALPRTPPPRAAASVASDATAVFATLGPRNPAIDIASLSEAALSGLATFLRGLAIAPEALAGAAAGGFGLALIPTNGSLGRWTKVPGPGDVSVFVQSDEPKLDFRYTTADGVEHAWTAAAVAGVYRGPDGKVIARWTKVAGASALIVSTAALLKDERPKLCPATVPDEHGPNGLAYEEFMKGLLNPGNPTPTGMAYGFYGPAGDFARIDDCQQQTGILAEYKGPGYAYHLRRGDFIWKKCLKSMIEQASRQEKASEGRPLIWFFAEWSVYREVKKVFAESFPNIQVRYFAMPGQRRRK